MTLVEMIVVIALTGVVLGAIGRTLAYFYRTNAYVIEQTQAVEGARRSTEGALADLREASYGDDGSYPISDAATSTVTFYADIVGDASVERVRYYLSGTTFYRAVTQSAGNPPSYAGQDETVDVVVDNIRNGTSTPLFRYYDADGDELPAPIDASKIASVKATVMTDVNPDRAPAVYTLVESATIRSLRDMSAE